VIEINLGEDFVYTDVSGFRQLLKFYQECRGYENSTIYIKLDNIQWIDGNLCAFLGALLFRLTKENKLNFAINAKQVSDKCGILFHNNFIPLEQNIKQYAKKSCVPYQGFYPKQKDEFLDYLENELLVHPAMPKLKNEIKEKLIDDLTEIYANIDKHAETGDPFFVCGQYYPSKGYLNFTISDLGVGFFKKIKELQPDKIHSCGDAILWAVAGNSTKLDAPGGSGLKNLNTYLDNNNGGLQILTGDAGWCSRTAKASLIFPNGITDLRNNYLGAAINLEFNKKTLIS
jgi:hypothetical protein